MVILEPSGGELRVHDGYQFLNDSSPPVTYSSEEGTLRFHLPAEAGGEVEVSGRGPARMPLPSTALPAGEPGLYKVDFPLKPGDNQLDLSYTVPYGDGTEFTLRSTYPGSVTRVGAPQGVDVSGSGVTPLGQEPTTKASLFLISDEPEVTMTITGEGRLTRSSGGTGSGESEISIQPAPVRKRTCVDHCSRNADPGPRVFPPAQVETARRERGSSPQEDLGGGGGKQAGHPRPGRL